MSKQIHRITLSWVSLVTLLALTACDHDSDPSGGGGSTPATISGTATTGTAIAGRTVNAKCASGTLSATTAADGGYQMALGSATLPCVLQVSTSDGTLLHSVAVGSGAVTAHVTQVTHLVAASIAGRAPADYFANFDAAAAAALASANLGAASSAVAAVLADAGLPSSSNPITTAHTQVLAPLAAAMASAGTTLPQLEMTVAAASPVNPPAPGGAPSLPAAQLLSPAAANCAALRSGTYRVVAPYYSNLDSQTGKVTIDAPTLQSTDSGGTQQTWVANGPCRFRADVASANPTDIVVSPAGVIVARLFGDEGKYRLAIAFPEQTHTVSELAGNWNMLGFEMMSGNSAATASYGGVASSGAVAAGGAVSNASFCPDITNCQSVTDSISLSSNAAGGFNLVNTTANWTDRAFAYRAGGGELMLVGIAGNGSFSVWTRQRTNGLSAPGDKSKTWGLWINTANASTSAVSESAFTTLSNDPAAGSWLRQSDIDGHQETLFANNPRAGYTHRPAATAQGNSGPVDVREFTSLFLRGTGLSVLWLPAVGLNTAPGAYFFAVTRL